jgi:hypothetical protein
VLLVIEGRDLPGRRFASYDDVHVGIQVRRDAAELVPGDAPSARWEADVRRVAGPAGLDWRGPVVQGKRGERFVYLTWGARRANGTFEMFRRAKLMLDRIDPALVAELDAVGDDGVLTAEVSLTDERGGPRCARVDPPAISWSVG